MTGPVNHLSRGCKKHSCLLLCQCLLRSFLGKLLLNADVENEVLESIPDMVL